MTTTQFFFLIPYLISMGISIWIGYLGWQRRRTRAAFALAGLAAAEALWILGYIAQLLSSGLTTVLFWNDVQFLGAVSVPFFFLVFSIRYSYQGSPFHAIQLKYFIPAPVGVLFLIWTDKITGLFRQNPYIAAGYPFARLIFTDGVTFPFFTIYAYSFIILGVILLVVSYLVAPRLYRYQIGVVLAGILVPWVVATFAALGWVNVGLHQITPLSFGISNTIIALALFRFKMLDIVPVAREILIEKMKDPVVVLDSEGLLVDLNPSAQQLFNKRIESLVGKPLATIVPEIDLLKMASLSNDSHSYGIQFASGKDIRFFEVDATLLSQSPSQKSGFLLVFHDVTNLKRTEQEIRRSMALVHATLNSSSSGVVVVDHEFNLLLFNQRLVTLFNLEPDWDKKDGISPLGSLVQKFKIPQDYYNLLDDLASRPGHPITTTFDLKNERSIEWIITPFIDKEDEAGWLFSFNDITERKKAADLLRHLAITDSLTGLFNRHYFIQLAQKEWNRAKRYKREMTLILLDIDYFKSVNDTYGHWIGDQVLSSLADCWRSCLREFDSIGRYGGEEFTILLPDTTITSARTIAERIRDATQKKVIPTPAGNTQITISLGLASYHPDRNPVTFDELFTQVDAALYAAKAAGRNQIATTLDLPPAAIQQNLN